MLINITKKKLKISENVPTNFPKHDNFKKNLTNCPKNWKISKNDVTNFQKFKNSTKE